MTKLPILKLVSTLLLCAALSACGNKSTTTKQATYVGTPDRLINGHFVSSKFSCYTGTSTIDTAISTKDLVLELELSASEATFSIYDSLEDSVKGTKSRIAAARSEKTLEKVGFRPFDFFVRAAVTSAELQGTIAFTRTTKKTDTLLDGWAEADIHPLTALIRDADTLKWDFRAFDEAHGEALQFILANKTICPNENSVLVVDLKRVRPSASSLMTPARTSLK